jgi:hypothetical protein
MKALMGGRTYSVGHSSSWKVRNSPTRRAKETRSNLQEIQITLEGKRLDLATLKKRCGVEGDIEVRRNGAGVELGDIAEGNEIEIERVIDGEITVHRENEKNAFGSNSNHWKDDVSTIHRWKPKPLLCRKFRPVLSRSQSGAELDASDVWSVQG